VKKISDKTLEGAKSSFREKKIMTIIALTKLLKCSMISARRYLKKWGTYTSYNIGGRYYTLQGTPKFNDYGIWNYKEVSFTKHGDLKNTIIYLVTKSEKGLTSGNIGKVVGLDPNSFMHHFKDLDGLRREKIEGRYVYFSNNPKKYKDQKYKRKQIVVSKKKTSLPSDRDSIVILVELIKRPSLTIEKLFQQVRRKGLKTSMSEVRSLLVRHGIKKNFGFKAVHALNFHLTNLLEGVSINNLFPKAPTLFFRPESSFCSCGRTLTSYKTEMRSVFTLSIGEFHAHETTFECKPCKNIYESDELKRLVPDGANYGFDVIEYVGRALFQKSHNEQRVRSALLAKGISISLSGVGGLGARFVSYLALCHEEICPNIKKLFQENGGFILHIDGTCEGASPILVTVIDGITGIVLNSVKVASEKKEQIVSILKKIKRDFGVPLAMMHDMGKGIVLACEEVFPGVLDFICHFHFLRDIGKDLFGQEYSLLFKNLMRQHKICSQLRAELKKLGGIIEKDSSLTRNLLTFEKSDLQKKRLQKLYPTNLAYVLINWILNYESDLKGYGLPFDRAYLVLFKRMEKVLLKINTMKKNIRSQKQLEKLTSILNKVFKDVQLVRNVREMEVKVKTFEELRVALRIALPEKNKGLNDDGEKEDMETIKKQVKDFKQNEDLKRKALNDLSYKRFLIQIDKYWGKLFTAPILISTPNGKKVIYPQRTNNILEQFFRKLKMLYRKRLGTHSLTKTLKSMIAETPFVHNLDNSDYIRILLKDKQSLAGRFADIDVKLVRQRLKEHHTRPNKISPQFKKIIQDKSFLKRLAVTA
jgi:hypothetical protein